MENENCPSPGKYQAQDGKIAAGTYLNQFNSKHTYKLDSCVLGFFF